MREFVIIFLGGGLGSILRYGVQIVMHERIVVYNFPWSTFAVNIVGSFLIGLFYAISEKFNLSAEMRMALTTGLCGGFTTFSTFSKDNLEMIGRGDWFMSMIYIVLSIVLGIGACYLGALTAMPSKLS